MGKEKSARVYLRVSKEEKEIITMKAESCGLSLSAYMLSASLNKKLIAIDQVNLFASIKSIQIEMNSIGKNINQYVKLLNMLNKIDGVTPDSLKDIEGMLLEYKLQYDMIHKCYKEIKSMYL